MGSILGISRSLFHGSLEMTSVGAKALSLFVIARSPEGRRGNLRARKGEIASPSARNDIIKLV